MDRKIIIASPSYKRASICSSHKIFDNENFYYIVREEEYELYLKIYKNIIPIPKGKVSNISNTRNWILDNVDCENILMVDDDYKSVNWLINRQRKKLSPSEIWHQIENGFTMAHDSGSALWGLNVNSDPMSYTICRPFSFSDVILGPWMGIIKSKLRFDESLPLKEDYDFSLLNLKEFRATLRFNFLAYEVDHEKMPGGCQTYRNEKFENEQNILLQKKWGSKIVKENPRNDRNTINMVVKSPI